MKKPKTTLIMATSIDGKISINDKSRLKFTSKEDKNLLYKMRGVSDCIIRGGINVRLGDSPMIIKDKKTLKKRVKKGMRKQPINVIISKSLKFDFKNSKIFNHKDTLKIIFVPKDTLERKIKIAEKYATIIKIDCDKDKNIFLKNVLDILKKDYGCKEILIEGGGILNYHMLKNNLVNEILLTLCPYVLGGKDGSGMTKGEDLINEKIRNFKLKKVVKNKHNEIFLHYVLSKNFLKIKKIKNSYQIK